MSGYAEEYECTFGNSGNCREQGCKTYINSECPNGKRIGMVILERVVGLLQVAVFYRIPLQTKDLHAGDITTYPKRTSQCT